MKKSFDFIVKYLSVGILSGLLNVILLFVFKNFFKMELISANIISLFIALIFNFILGRMIVFKKGSGLRKRYELLLYMIIGGLGFILDNTIFGVFVLILKWNYIISKIITSMFVSIWNYMGRLYLYDKIKRK